MERPEQLVRWTRLPLLADYLQGGSLMHLVVDHHTVQELECVDLEFGVVLLSPILGSVLPLGWSSCTDR